MSPDRKFILCIDGGGYRGLAALSILDHLMRQFEGPYEETPTLPCDKFNLICGSSTGGLIAILLGRLGLSYEEAADVYRELGRAMFSKDGSGALGRLTRGDSSSAELENVIGAVVEKHTGRKDTIMLVPRNRLNKSAKVFVTIVEETAPTAKPSLIRTYPTPRGALASLPPRYNWKIVQAVCATVASPLFFPPHAVASQKFQDASSSGYSNPVMLAIEEAKLIWPSQDVELVVVSLGAGLQSYKVPNSDAKGAEQQQNERLDEMAKKLAQVGVDTQMKHKEVEEHFKESPQNYFRFNPPQRFGNLGLGDIGQEKVIETITNVWIGTPTGRHAISKLVEKFEPYLIHGE